MTWNGSVDELRALLDAADRKHPNIRILINIGSSVSFLDVDIRNKNGLLSTKVYHKPTAEPYVLPYESDHPRHMHKSLPRAALLRAARFCSDVADFNEERIYIEMSFLLNGHPPLFIARCVQQFFNEFEASTVHTHLNPDAYQRLHSHLLRHRFETDEQHDQQRSVLIHYTFDSGPNLSFPKSFRQLWRRYFVDDPTSTISDVKLKIGTRTHYSLNDLLVRKKPPRIGLLKKS